MDLTTTTILAAVVTFVSPLLTSLFTKTQMSSKAKTVVAVVVSFVIAFGYVAVTGGVTDWLDVARWVPAVFGVQQAAYKLIFQNLATIIEAKYGLTDKNPGEHVAGAVTEAASDGSQVVVAVPEETPAKG